MKHTLKIKKYVRYSDDFIIVHYSKEYLDGLVPLIQKFIGENLKMFLHPKKIILRTFSQGIDFLGYIILPYHRVLRTKTKQRMIRKIREKSWQYTLGNISKKSFEQSISSYLGMLKHCNGRGVKREIKRYCT